MTIVAGDIITEAQSVYLNDSVGAIYPSDKLIPVLKKAYTDLQLRMIANGVSEVKEVSSLLTVPINTSKLDSLIAGFPVDLIEPISLSERPSGSSELFSPMTRTTWEPEVLPDEFIKYWDWREGEIKVNPATAIQQVKIRYSKGYTQISGINSTIARDIFQSYLAARTAAIAALTIGNNTTRATACDGEANRAIGELLGIFVKDNQGIPVRRKRFKPFKGTIFTRR